MTDKDPFERLVDAVGQCQAQNFTTSYILTEIVTQLATREDDPHAYLAKMFESVISRWESLETIEKAQRPVNVETRWLMETFFSTVGKRFP